MRTAFVTFSALLLVSSFCLGIFFGYGWYILFGTVLVHIIGYYDMYQKKRSIMRICPLFGRLRFLVEELRPKIYQYFIESDILPASKNTPEIAAIRPKN